MAQVTVLLPVHNGANYLETAIQSVLRQTHVDFVLHVLDDGSSDESADIAQSVRDPRVRYSRNSARFGLFKTLNRGFFEAQTSLVRIWAHDDLMLPDCMERFVHYADSYQSCGMFYCDFYTIDVRGVRTGKETLYAQQRERTPRVSDPHLSAALFLCFGCLPGNISTVMLRREAWEKIGGFVEGLQQSPDYDMWLRLSHDFQVGFIPEKLMELRDHPLQLAKVGQKHLTTIREELPIFRQLQRRLAHVTTAREIARFWRQQRGRQHIHWIARALLRGEITSARNAWRELGEYGERWRQVSAWAITGNGRYAWIDPPKFFDELVARGLVNSGVE